jgi:glutamine synthetase
MVDAIAVLTAPKNVELFEKFHIFNQSELESRSEVLYENYAKVINIEAQTMLHMASKHYIPAVIRYCGELATSINAMRSACPGMEIDTQEQLLRRVNALLQQASENHAHLARVTEDAHSLAEGEAAARAFREQVVPAMQALRAAVDKMELLVNKAYWPVPTYGDLMFEV